MRSFTTLFRRFGALALCAALLPPAGRAEVLNGAGSSAAAPVYRAWAKAYGATADFQLQYDPAGSSAGVQRIKSRTVGFGASDVAPQKAQLDADGLVAVPAFVSGVVPVINVPKVRKERLRLNAEVLSAIFMGEIVRWDAPEIARLNPDVSLPSTPIRPVVRSDGSGTTYYFTDYLSRVNPAWKQQFGAKNTIAWPPAFVAARGSDGVAKAVDSTPGAIGYIDYNYVVEGNLNPVVMQNAAGQYIRPGVEAFRAALLASEWRTASNFHATLANLDGRNSWPITMGTFVLLPKVSDKPRETALAINFLVWALLKGDQVVEGMSFVRLPDNLQAMAYKALSGITDRQGRALGLEALASATKAP